MQALDGERVPRLPVCPVKRCLNCPARAGELCRGLGSDDLDDLYRTSRRVRLPADQSLIVDGDAEEAVYVVVSGVMRLSRLGVDGRRQILAFLFTGDFIGFAQGHTYHYNAEAVTEAELCAFEQPRFSEFLRRHPQMADNVSALAATALELANQTIFTLGKLAAEERVAAFILMLERAAGQRHGTVEMPMSRQDIADYLGLTNETVSRCLTRLRRDGLIALPRRHRVVIRDRAGLEVAAALDDGGPHQRPRPRP